MVSPGTQIDHSVENIPSRDKVFRPLIREYRVKYPNGLMSWSDDDIPDPGQKRFMLEDNPEPERVIVGFQIYRYRKAGSNEWDAKISWCSTKPMREKPQCRARFESPGAARRQCESWRVLEERRLETEYPGSHAGISEVPLGELLERRHFRQLWAARIRFKKRFEPHYYEWCMRMAAAQSAEDRESLPDEKEICKAMDKAERGEDLAPVLELKGNRISIAAVKKLTCAIAHGKRPKMKPNPQNLKIDKELLAGWIRRGYIFLPRWMLTLRLNQKLGTKITEDALEKRVKRLGLNTVVSCGALEVSERDYLRLMDWPINGCIPFPAHYPA